MKKKSITLIISLCLIAISGCLLSKTISEEAETAIDASNQSMAFIPEGIFLMGDENELHEVDVSGFYIDLFEVTNLEYQKCIDDDVCDSPAYPESVEQQSLLEYLGYFEENSPVTFISWEQAQNYCIWRDARLPTEAEWEKAARGTDGLVYPWGDEISCSFANYGGIEQMCVGKLKEVGSYPQGVSPYGVFDMSGNVDEWTSDCRTENYDWHNSGYKNPKAPNQANCSRVIRGGNYTTTDAYLKTFSRWSSESTPDPFIGFRCVQSP